MPNRVTICFAVCVTLSRSFEAPVGLVEDYLPLSSEHHRQLRHELGAAHHEPILCGRLIVTLRPARAWDDRDLVHGVGLRQQGADDGVPGLVVAVISFSFSEMSLVFLSGPAMTRSMASSISDMSIWSLSCLAARSAASLTRFARSAPVNPGVPRARVPTSTSLPNGLASWTRRIFSRPGGRDGQPRSAGQTFQDAGAPGRVCRGGWWRRA